MATSVFTDGSCIGNGSSRARGGIGVFFGPGDPRNVSKAAPPATKVTNQTMELRAISMALDAILGHDGPAAEYYLHSDSEYAIKCVTHWIHGWRRNGWRTAYGKPVLNREVITEIWDKLQACEDRGITVQFQHVRAHKAAPSAHMDPEAYAIWFGNEQADRLARAGAGSHCGTEGQMRKVPKEAAGDVLAGITAFLERFPRGRTVYI